MTLHTKQPEKYKTVTDINILAAIKQPSIILHIAIQTKCQQLQALTYLSYTVSSVCLMNKKKKVLALMNKETGILL